MKKFLSKFINYINSEKGKLRLIEIIIFSGFIFSVVRLFHIQVIKGDQYRKLNYKQFYGSKIIKPLRGNILDRNLNNFTFYSKKNGREYPLGIHSSQVIGIVGKNGNGLSGIELKYNDYLKGVAGWKAYDKFNFKGKHKSKIDGDNVILTIDQTIQNIADEELLNGIKRTNAKSGSVIVSNPKTGDILAMSSYPFFDPNNKGHDNMKNLKNLSIGYSYEPGSVLKVLPAVIVLENYMYSPDDFIPNTDKRHVKFYDRTFTDHETEGHLMTFKTCLMRSSNVGFTTIASKIDPQTMWEYALDFGIGNKTGIELTGEEHGYLKKIGTKEWTPLTKLSMAIGYGLLATPIQVLTIYNTVANNGYKILPHVVKEIRDNKNQKIVYRYHLEQYMITKIGSKSTFLKLKNMLQAVVDSGTSVKAKIDGVRICGKTGTSEKSTAKGYSSKEHNTTFVGFLPKDDPVLSCIVVLDSPDSKHKFASNSAVPIFKKVIKRILLDPSLIYNEKIRVSDKEKMIAVPNLVGLKKHDAITKIKKLGFNTIISGNGHIIINQLPHIGVELPKNGKITLFVGDSLDNNLTKLNNYIGMSLRNAVFEITKNGYIPIVNGSGIVISQDPSAGSKIETGSEVKLFCKLPME